MRQIVNRLQMIFQLTALAATIFLSACQSTPTTPQAHPPLVDPGTNVAEEVRVHTGAEILISDRMDLLKNKRIAVVANHTSLVFGSNDKEGVHLVDTLHARGINIVKVFAPEHGFRGDQDAGKHVSNSVDTKTGIKIESLYGKNKKPNAAQMEGIELVLFDIQDVGARFYTYISTMSYVMEACAEQKIAMVILDRPNPNGWYVEGPVMEDPFKSFIGMHNVPTVHGLTIGEYALMVNGQGWLAGGVRAPIDVIKCIGYQHNMRWAETGLPWVAPSPNLASEYSAYLYPMLCWFEGLHVSVGRGTPTPFEILGAPWHKGYAYQIMKDSVEEAESPGKMSLFGLEAEYIRFTPRSTPGKSLHPDFENQVNYGVHFLNRVSGEKLFMAGLSLLKNFEEEAKNTGQSTTLYQASFNQLMGNNSIKTALKKGQSEKEIFEAWQPGLSRYLTIRKNYLLYPDFN